MTCSPRRNSLALPQTYKQGPGTGGRSRNEKPHDTKLCGQVGTHGSPLCALRVGRHLRRVECHGGRTLPGYGDAYLGTLVGLGLWRAGLMYDKNQYMVVVPIAGLAYARAGTHTHTHTHTYMRSLHTCVDHTHREDTGDGRIETKAKAKTAPRIRSQRVVRVNGARQLGILTDIGQHPPPVKLLPLKTIVHSDGSL